MNMDGRLIRPVSCPGTIESPILIVPFGNLGIPPLGVFFGKLRSGGPDSTLVPVFR